MKTSGCVGMHKLFLLGMFINASLALAQGGKEQVAQMYTNGEDIILLEEGELRYGPPDGYRLMEADDWLKAKSKMRGIDPEAEANITEPQEEEATEEEEPEEAGHRIEDVTVEEHVDVFSREVVYSDGRTEEKNSGSEQEFRRENRWDKIRQKIEKSRRGSRYYPRMR